jgi:hypothetical protein
MVNKLSLKNFEKMNCNFIKSEINVEILRNMLEQ